MILFTALFTGCIPFNALENLENPDTALGVIDSGSILDTGTGETDTPTDTSDTIDTTDTTETGVDTNDTSSIEWTTVPESAFGLDTMYGWHFVFDGNTSLKRTFGTDPSGNVLEEEFDSFLLPANSTFGHMGKWGFAFSLAPQNPAVSDWMFGSSDDAAGAEFALFRTNDVLISMQFVEDEGNDSTKRWVYPLLRYTFFGSDGRACFFRQVPLSIRNQNYLPNVETLQDGMQFLVDITPTFDSGNVSYALSLRLREGRGAMQELYNSENFLDSIEDTCSDFGQSTTDGFEFGLGGVIRTTDDQFTVQNIVGRVDDLIIFDRGTTTFAYSNASFSGVETMLNSDGMHYLGLNFVTMSGADGFGWWGFENYTATDPAGNQLPSESRLVVDLSSETSSMAAMTNPMEFCFVNASYEVNCINETSTSGIQTIESMYRSYENSMWDEDNW